MQIMHIIFVLTRELSVLQNHDPEHQVWLHVNVPYGGDTADHAS